VEIVPEDGHHSSSTSFPEALPLKENDIYKAVCQVTEKIHGEFGAAAIMTGLSGKLNHSLAWCPFLINLFHVVQFYSETRDIYRCNYSKML